MTGPRQTKILATLGPATVSEPILAELVAAGADAIRVNASHGELEAHAKHIAMVRRVAAAAGRRIGVLFDLQGPKIRVGDFEGPPRTVEAGEEIRLAVGRAPEPGELPSDYDRLDQDVRVGHALLIDDGSIAARVTEVTEGRVIAVADNEGVVRPRKGINLPESQVSAPAITDKDRQDALFAAAQGVDLIALSFVRTADDVRALQELLADAGHSIPVVAKIEKPQALEHLDDIVEASWGVMVARGDLGVELSPEEVPVAQKRIIAQANRMARPVITATQMLESMTRNPRPTRAEASDVANAVLDGTDVAMLSAETAVGRYPVESVAMMTRVICTTEALGRNADHRPRRAHRIGTIQDAVAEACCQVADHLGAQAIAVFTKTGASALLVAQRRPASKILAFTPDPAVSGRLSLVRGVGPVDVAPAKTVDERVERMDSALLRDKHASPGDIVVLCMAAPNAEAGSTDLMMVHKVGEDR